MKLNRKLWTAALAVAMTTPSAMAAQDTAGMHYTSAAEGFYASIRLRYVSNVNKKDGGSDIENGSSRFGVRGTNDLGSGLEGFYQYEMGVGTENGNKDMSTRVAHVGLRGDFGDVVAGAFWPNTYNWVYGSTDVANRQSGYVTSDLGQYRTSKSLQYTTPDLNGFRGAVLVKADSSADGQTHGNKAADYGVGKGGNSKDDNDIDHWSLAAAYDIAGFSMGLSYSNYPDAIAGLRFKNRGVPASVAEGLDRKSTGTSTLMTVVSYVDGNGVSTLSIDKAEKDDLTAWAFKLGYSQDNWYVNGWYGKESTGDIGSYTVDRVTDVIDSSTGTAVTTTMTDEGAMGGSFSDNEIFSLAGGISVDKVAVYAVYENKESDMVVNNKHIRGDDTYTTLGVQYTLGSNSWTWVEYAGRDLDSSDSEDDGFSIGLGHSF